ncbi:LOW QUALITY PROTEIN: CDP-glycerol:poly(glycerophosphate) glycerophosphotransferase, partial [Micromonospora sp. ATCC 39149]
MTLISFVVPAYRVQAYLSECLDSILGQPFDDVEIIGVDDHSPDGGGDILADYAARDHRVHAVRLDDNVGLGPARNVGLDRAGGEYVWFVDGDDWLAPDCLAEVAARLRRTRPDVLLVDHVRVRWDGRVTRSAMAEVFPAPPGEETFRLRERPEALRLLHTAWNRLVRREFLVDLGLRFEPGWYEDVAFSYPVLMAAERIGVLDRVCLNYRQRRAGAITRTRGDRHFEVFEQWHRVFRWMDERIPAVDGLRPAVFERMIWHYLTVLGNGERIAPELRPAFFDRITADYVRWLPPGGYPAPPGVEGLKHRLVAAGRWRTFSALRAANQARQAAARQVRRGRPVARRAARLGRDAVLREYYLAELRRPLDRHLAVYAAYWYRGYACNPAAIYEAARRLAPQVRGVWIVRRDRVESLPPGVEYVVAGSREYHRVLARASSWLGPTTGELPRLRPQAPWRGARADPPRHPVKVMGLDQQRYPGRRGRDGLREAAAPGGPLGLQHLGEQLLHPDVGAGVPGRVHHFGGGLPAQRPAGHRDLHRGTRGARPARPGPRRPGRAVRADAPRAPARVPAAVRPGAAVRRARPHRPAAGAQSLLRRPRSAASPRPRPRAGLRPGAGARRQRPRPGGGPLPRRRRAGHRLLVGDVRLRRAGPADRGLRAGLGGVPVGPGRLPRPARRAARRGDDQLPRPARPVPLRRGRCRPRDHGPPPVPKPVLRLGRRARGGACRPPGVFRGIEL